MEAMFVQTPEQRAVLDTVRRFVEEVVRPRAAELDARADPAESYSWEIVERAHAVGIRTMTLGREYGGLGADALTTAMVIEELGRGDLGVSVIFAQTLKIAQIMQKALSPEQRARVLPGFAADPRGMLAIGITEPDVSSDYLVPHPTPFRSPTPMPGPARSGSRWRPTRRRSAGPGCASRAACRSSSTTAFAPSSRRCGCS